MANLISGVLNGAQDMLDTAGSKASTISNIAGVTDSLMQGMTEGTSTQNDMQTMSNKLNRMARDTAQMQYQQAMTAAFTNILKSGASNVKSASQAG
ncbi:hypothetical protein [Burkholderia oklahomensis]|uniref:hypothetical protein n=1 Tax=Burkholderia oklahomensis TaxID=342113 RepID=UPI00016A7CA1|nr:hypothetical protein [Burkholderia oklahomensis]AJX35230.1 hypothetical protein BG90_5657 [Burkholderia oklahomensis C6786]AOI49287.1 hypothetical protein WI23_26240 [Burkholderia oklahomensis C6786]KUY60666.1 hypothetical protein WI23_13265 [Burkholderia oklahomensis C6786]MBI0362468.1 hypothetical protein [Burkholderia oklahomensis]SUY26575.1 Uncharacterised protein [Burkholderia oklahomensis]